MKAERDICDGASFVRVRGARTHNLKNVDVDVPRNAMVVFTGVSGSGKSSLAFDTIFAEAQGRYLESIAPHARRLIEEAESPQVESIEGLPPAIALRQNRTGTQGRSTVGSVTRIAVALRLLFARAGTYDGGKPQLDAEAFSPNNPSGACPECHGLGIVHEVREETLVPDPGKSIRQKAIVSWPNGWQGKNQRDILTSLGYDIDLPWKDLSKSDREWILSTDEQPNVPVYAGSSKERVAAAIKAGEEPSYMGTFVSARRYILENFARSDAGKKRLASFVTTKPCPSCHGQRLNKDALAVTFAGQNIAKLMDYSVLELSAILRPYAEDGIYVENDDPSVKAAVIRLTSDIKRRLDQLTSLGLGHLSLNRRTTMLSSGEMQRLRLATQLLSQLFGVVYVLDEPSAGLHPADVETLMALLGQLRQAGNTLFIVEHNLDVIRQAEWIVDVGPEAGERGGKIVYSGVPGGLSGISQSRTGQYLFAKSTKAIRDKRLPEKWLELRGVHGNNLVNVDVDLPLERMTIITGVSGSGKSTLLSHVLPNLFDKPLPNDDNDESAATLENDQAPKIMGWISAGGEHVERLIRIDQKPIGRTPRSNLATYTGFFDTIRKLFADTPDAQAKHYTASHFSFNLLAGRCPVCEGQGQRTIELMYLPSMTARCTACNGARYNDETLTVRWQDRNIAEVLDLTVEDALAVFGDHPSILRSLEVLNALGLGYLRLGQPATELSGGESQRIKLSTELQRQQHNPTMYLLDEPSNGLHPADMDRLLHHLDQLVGKGHTVVMIEHDMRIAAQADWIIDIGPGAGKDGGKVVATGTPERVANAAGSRTAGYLKIQLAKIGRQPQLTWPASEAPDD